MSLKPNGKAQIKYTQVGLPEVSSTKVFILDSHINPLTYNLFLNQGQETQTIPQKFLFFQKKNQQSHTIQTTSLFNLTFQNLENFGMWQTTTLKKESRPEIREG